MMKCKPGRKSRGKARETLVNNLAGKFFLAVNCKTFTSRTEKVSHSKLFFNERFTLNHTKI